MFVTWENGRLGRLLPYKRRPAASTMFGNAWPGCRHTVDLCEAFTDIPGTPASWLFKRVHWQQKRKRGKIQGLKVHFMFMLLVQLKGG